MLSRNGTDLAKIPPRKWALFLCSLANQHQMNGPDLTFDSLNQLSLFAYGRKGHKSARTVAVEIDNFRRQMKTLGLVIIKRKRGEATTYRIDVSTCTISKSAQFSARLNHLRGSSDALDFWIKPDLGTQLDWLFASMRGKVAFAQGAIDTALSHQKQALALTDDPYLNAATYAEIARISYRADRDLALDMRDQAMDFVESGKMNGAVAQIFEPRIKVSYAFQDDVSPEIQCQNLDRIAANYLTRGIDIAGLCRALNTRGAMRRRAANDAAGLSDFQLGSALAITTNDPDLIQASLFNILAALEFSSSISAAKKIEGAELNAWFCQQFNIGGDSAQSELLHAQFYIENGDFAQARATIKRAAILLRHERNATDVAFYFYSLANFAHSQTGDHPRTKVRLSRAERIYKRVGNTIGLRKVALLKAKLNQTA